MNGCDSAKQCGNSGRQNEPLPQEGKHRSEEQEVVIRFQRIDQVATQVEEPPTAGWVETETAEKAKACSFSLYQSVAIPYEEQQPASPEEENGDETSP